MVNKRKPVWFTRLLALETTESTCSSFSLSRILMNPMWSFPPKWSANLETRNKKYWKLFCWSCNWWDLQIRDITETITRTLHKGMLCAQRRWYFWIQITSITVETTYHQELWYNPCLVPVRRFPSPSRAWNNEVVLKYLLFTYAYCGILAGVLINMIPISKTVAKSTGTCTTSAGAYANRSSWLSNKKGKLLKPFLTLPTRTKGLFQWPFIQTCDHCHTS